MINAFLILFLFLATPVFAQTDNKQCFGLGEVIGGVPSPDKVCCLGLQSKSAISWYDANCQVLPVGGAAGICVACGDGICDEKYENKCNCPEDCAKDPIKKGN